MGLGHDDDSGRVRLVGEGVRQEIGSVDCPRRQQIGKCFTRTDRQIDPFDHHSSNVVDEFYNVEDSPHIFIDSSTPIQAVEDTALDTPAVSQAGS